MSLTFTKLFSSITESSIWMSDDQVRLVWITFLAMADRRGRVWASIPGLANRARVSVESTERAIALFLAPDEYSRTKDFDGRRIEPIDGGWRLLNYQKYREVRDEESRRIQNAEAQARWRNKNSKQVSQSKPEVSQNKPTSKPNAEAEAEAEADKYILSGKPDEVEIYSAHARIALHWLNEKSGKKFRESESSLAPINARLKEQGVDIEGVKKMIERQCQRWLGTSMAEYLRPSTLFGKEKFNEYYAARELPVIADGKQNQQRIDRSIGTANEGKAANYRGIKSA